MPRRFSHSLDGSISVEAALIMSFVFVPVLLGLWDVAQIAVGQAQVQEALQDAITYVAAGNSGNSSGITAAAQSAYGTSISVSTSTACYCVSTSSSSAPSSVSCSGSCSGDLEQFMSLTVSKTVSIPFTVPYLGHSVTVESSGEVRTG